MYENFMADKQFRIYILQKDRKIERQKDKRLDQRQKDIKSRQKYLNRYILIL